MPEQTNDFHSFPTTYQQYICVANLDTRIQNIRPFVTRMPLSAEFVSTGISAYMAQPITILITVSIFKSVNLMDFGKVLMYFEIMYLLLVII